MGPGQTRLTRPLSAKEHLTPRDASGPGSDEQERDGREEWNMGREVPPISTINPNLSTDFATVDKNHPSG
jgi:hypothetical protein